MSAIRTGKFPVGFETKFVQETRIISAMTQPNPTNRPTVIDLLQDLFVQVFAPEYMSPLHRGVGGASPILETTPVLDAMDTSSRSAQFQLPLAAASADEVKIATISPSKASPPQLNVSNLTGSGLNSPILSRLIGQHQPFHAHNPNHTHKFYHSDVPWLSVANTGASVRSTPWISSSLTPTNVKPTSETFSEQTERAADTSTPAIISVDATTSSREELLTALKDSSLMIEQQKVYISSLLERISSL